MTGRILLKENQKEVLAQFYSNFALAWVTFGVINPVFNPPADAMKLVLGIIGGITASAFFLWLALKFFK